MPQGPPISDSPNSINLVGVRVDAVVDPPLGAHPDRIAVALWLFAESRSRHWETGRLDDAARPVTIGPDDLEAKVKRVVWPNRLDELAQTLRAAGVQVQTEELERLPFVVEATRRLERQIAKRRSEM